MEALKNLFESYSGRAAKDCVELTSSGSNRRYFRLTGGNLSIVGVIGTNKAENNAFVSISRHFIEKGIRVPRVLAVSEDGMRYIQEDLGDDMLYNMVAQGRDSGVYSSYERALLVKTIEQLPKIQFRGGEGMDWKVCFPEPAFNERMVMFDLNYFKYCFLKATGLDFHELKLEATFQLMARDIVSLPGEAFMYRDFQARNVMLDQQGNPWFIDFQGGRRGPLQYDVASFLWQASARYSKSLRQELIKVYIDNLKQYTEVNEKRFREGLRICVLFRLLQVLGAYGFRGYFERKKHFLESIPPAMQNLRDLLAEGGCPYPYLRDLLNELVELPQFAPEPERPVKRADGYKTTENNPYNAHVSDGPATFSKYDGQGPLVVKVFSFSYRKGIPEDESGNGGGYVFDCRSTHNPGRYEPYKKLTGLDEPVIRFLEDDGEILTFLESVYRLADAHVQRYIQRGFTSLMFCFGCTGGQHRSVYSAQHLALHIHEKFGVEVQICHREQGIKQTLTALPPARAMIFAAGLGTRLKPLTDSMPKALVPVGGKPLLQHLLEKLKAAGFRDAVINVHHFADMIEDWCSQNPMGVNVYFSDERQELLETGGGIKHAAPLLRDARDGFLIHNVDILSNVDLQAFMEYGRGRAATLLVSERQTQRYLLFDDDMRLVGWTNTETGEVRSPYPHLDASRYRRLAFAGIHQMSPSLFRYFQEWGDRFSIIDFYLGICDREAISGYVQPGLRLLDIGKQDTLQKAEDFLNTLNQKAP